MKRLKSLWLLLVVPVIVGVLIDRFTKIDLIGAMWSGLRWVGHLFVISCSLPVWGIILLMLALPAVLLLLVLMLARHEPDPSYEDYTSDSFFGISWHWRLYGGRLDDHPPTARCPHCSGLLEPQLVWNRVKLACDHCGFEKTFEGMDGTALQERVRKEIDRKLVTGEWKAVVRQYSSASRL